jgi:hypothetical protein
MPPQLEDSSVATILTQKKSPASIPPGFLSPHKEDSAIDLSLTLMTAFDSINKKHQDSDVSSITLDSLSLGLELPSPIDTTSLLTAVTPPIEDADQLPTYNARSDSLSVSPTTGLKRRVSSKVKITSPTETEAVLEADGIDITVHTDNPSHLFWVPAPQHPEMAPAKFTKFLETHSHSTETPLSPPKLKRRSSLYNSVATEDGSVSFHPPPEVKQSMTLKRTIRTKGRGSGRESSYLQNRQRNLAVGEGPAELGIMHFYLLKNQHPNAHHSL